MIICFKHKKEIEITSELIPVCEECLIDFTGQALANWGKADCFICPECGQAFYEQYYKDHWEAYLHHGCF